MSSNLIIYSDFTECNSSSRTKHKYKNNIIIIPFIAYRMIYNIAYIEIFHIKTFELVLKNLL